VIEVTLAASPIQIGGALDLAHRPQQRAVIIVSHAELLHGDVNLCQLTAAKVGRGSGFHGAFLQVKGSFRSALSALLKKPRSGSNTWPGKRLSDGAGGLKDQDVILWSGQTVELPSDHEVTKALEHQGLLEPISQAQVSEVAPAAQADKSTTTRAK